MATRYDANRISTAGNIGDWQGRHRQAMARIPNPVTPETAMVALVKGWVEYANAHRERYGSGIGDDGVLGQPWATIGEGLRVLLNGDCGRLDCGTLDGILSDTLTAEGHGHD